MSNQQPTFGRLITDLNLGNVRDAIHVACIAVAAGEPLAPGDHVMIDRWDGGQAWHYGRKSGVATIGIVDPFLCSRVMPGDRFWLFLYPGSITSLRHQWTHPAFEDSPVTQPIALPPSVEEQQSASEKWLRDYASTHDVPSYEIMMEEVDKHIQNEIYVEWVTIHGYSAYDTIPPEFWTHYENVRGVKVGELSRATSFSCAC